LFQSSTTTCCHAGRHSGQPGIGGVVHEVTIAKVAQNPQTLSLRQDRQHIQLAGEIQVGKQTIAGLNILKSGSHGDLAELSMVANRNACDNLFAQDNHVFKAIVVQIPHEDQRR